MNELSKLNPFQHTPNINHLYLSLTTSPTASPNHFSAQPSLIQAVYGVAVGTAIVAVVLVAIKPTLNDKPHKKSAY